MSDSLKRQLDEYIKEISDAVFGEKKKKTAFLEQLRLSISDFVENTPDASMDDVIKCFGEPKEIAGSFNAEADIADIRKRLSLKKIITAVLIAALIIYLIFVVLSLIDVHSEAHGYFAEGLLHICSLDFKGGCV